MEVTVPSLLDGVRVDRAVALLAGVSRATAAELVERGAVELDGRPVTTRSAPLRAGASLSVALPETAEQIVEAEPDVVVPVVAEDEDVIVVDKPPGLVVHPGAGRERGTLVAGLLARYPELSELPAAGLGDPARPGIVHRLDRGTSGLLVVARSARAYRSLTEQLAARQVHRRYLALVAGIVADERGVVDAPLGRSTRQPTKMAVVAGGREARTAYRVLGRDEGPPPVSLLSLELETGRTHQIRVHLSAIGHPVVGDDLYGRPDGRLAEGRLFLHSTELSFAHPADGRPVGFESPLPEDLAALVPGGG
ncbi:MAG TPA: RluA family pseudouridine synthase [Acidimicrobiales bacterium]|nr:RluA family pseudouridine synthase [Acidimicrobiales bacterium]